MPLRTGAPGIADPDRRRVRRRKVFYIPGFDPFPPRRYRELYRQEAAAQAALSGHVLDLGRRTGPGFGWTVSSVVEGAAVDTDIEVLVWSDIVRRSMSSGLLATYLQLLATAWIYLSTGALRRLMRLRKGPILAAFYPVGMLALQLAAAICAGAMTGYLAARMMFAAGPSAMPALLPVLAATAAGALVAVAVLRWFRASDGRIYAHYLMHDYAFASGLRGADPPELLGRYRDFADRIEAALDQDVDEVLVVGHSSGAQIAVSVLAQMLRYGPARDAGPALSLLSLGQVIPMVSFLPEAHRLRADLQLLSTSRSLAWVDVSAPGDGCAFALCDPVAVSGLPSGRWPLILSAAFTRTLRPDTWTALRWRFFRLHFQYQCAFDNLTGEDGEYDYFAVTAGPKTLSGRFASRHPSRSRIIAAVSAYRSTAA